MNDWKKEGFRYFCLGLNSKEIGKLLDLSHRTVQGTMGIENWKEQRQQIRDNETKRMYRKFLKQQRNEKAKK